MRIRDEEIAKLKIDIELLKMDVKTRDSEEER